MSSDSDKSVTIQELEIMAQQAGLSLSREEAEEIMPIYQSFRQRLREMHQLDLGDEEPEAAFSASWPLGKEGEIA